MAQSAESLRLLSRALDQTGALVAGIQPEQADWPTPCRSWTVRHLVSHLIADLDNFATSVRGGSPDWSKATADVEGDWGDTFVTGRRDLDEAWSSADLASPVPTMGGGEAPLVSKADQQIAELAVHAWDIERATAQSEDLDAEVAAYGLHWGMQNLRPQFRGPEDEGKSFGNEVSVPHDAPIYERLAGWFGRDPGWSGEATGWRPG